MVIFVKKTSYIIKGGEIISEAPRNEETIALRKLSEIFTRKANKRAIEESQVKPKKAIEVAPSQRVVTLPKRVIAPSQRVVVPPQRVTPHQKLILENSMQRVNLKKRTKRLADKLAEAIRHKLSIYSSPIQKKERSINKQSLSSKKKKGSKL